MMTGILNHIPLLSLLAWITGCGDPSTSGSESDVSADSVRTVKPIGTVNDTATFAGGCFWCIEAVFERVKGVVEVVSGYSGGDEPDPTYNQVGSGVTGHAESVQIYFDSTIVSFETLLDVLFHVTDPTQADGQHPDYGRQYRTAVFYHDARQMRQTQAMITRISGDFKNPIVTEVSAFKFFQLAEAYHQDYVRHNPNDPYVRQWSVPKVEKFRKLYPELYFEPSTNE